MRTKLVILVAVAVAPFALASAAAPGSVATKQRVAIAANAGVHSFVLTPLKVGSLGRDSGTATFCCWTERVVRRDGQKVEVDNPLATLEGKNGLLKLRFRIEWANAGNGYVVGTGTWKVVSGTGAYKGVTGGGRSAHAWLPRGPISWRAEGFLTPGSKAVTAATGVVTPLAAAGDREKASLKRYLWAMSWPVRASLLEAQTVRDGIDGFISPGDPPFLGLIVRGCRKLREIQARGRVLAISAPKRFRGSHRKLIHKYSAVRQACRNATATARNLLAAIDRYYKTRGDEDKAALDRADRATHTVLLRFERGALKSFFPGVRAWRSAALQCAASLGAPAPRWLKGLPVNA